MNKVRYKNIISMMIYMAITFTFGGGFGLLPDSA